jgi:transposase-like protein
MAAACPDLGTAGNLPNVQTPTDTQTVDAGGASERTRHPIRYDLPFKLEAIHRWKTSRRSAGEIARELGISAATLYGWSRDARLVTEETVAADEIHALAEEISSLSEENTKLKQQREVLRKTLSILARSSDGRTGTAKPAVPTQPRRIPEKIP